MSMKVLKTIALHIITMLVKVIKNNRPGHKNNYIKSNKKPQVCK